MHDVAPTASVNLPGSHSPHSVAAKGRLADFPGTHAVQLPLKLGLALPASHAWHPPSSFASKPGSQLHRVAPASEVPSAPHSKHDEAPAAPWYVPGAHAVQPEAPAAPAYEPGGQLIHLAADTDQFPVTDDTTVTLPTSADCCSKDKMSSPL